MIPADIIGTKTPAANGEKKPLVKHEGQTDNQHDRQNNSHHRNNTPGEENFLGSDPGLRGYVFETKNNRSEQVVNFITVNTIIKAQVGTECDSFVFGSLLEGG